MTPDTSLAPLILLGLSVILIAVFAGNLSF